MKKLITAYLLFILIACAHHEPLASPAEVNDYLNKIAERSIIDPLG
jgi:hypothetical protein